jgi:hypothetical protein
MKQSALAFAVVRKDIETGSEYIDLGSIDKTEAGALGRARYGDDWWRHTQDWLDKHPVVRRISVLIEEQ